MSYNNLTYINSGDKVSASVTNVPLRELKRETESLQEKFETTEAGHTLIFRDIPCNVELTVGTPVYWDSETQQCEAAYITTELDSTTQEFVTGKPSDCIGIVYHKNSSQSVDILVSGLVSFPEISTKLKGNTGKIYLGNTPGTLTCLPQSHSFPLGVALGSLGPCDSNCWVYFNPCFTNNVFQHQHYKIDLKSVETNLTTVAGWRPVSSSDKAPTGCLFVYNISADTELSKVWPPVPLEAVSCTVDWANSSESIGGKEITINEDNSLMKITSKGIFWTSNTIKPFPSSINGYRKFRVTLNFSKITYSNRNEYVTSLQPDNNQPFKFVNKKGEESKCGDLFARFTLKDEPVDSLTCDGYGIREFNNEWKSERVPIVNGISITGNGIASGTRTFNLNGTDYVGGAVALNLSPYASNTEISPQIIKVGAAQEREIYGITYLGLPSGRNSSLRMKFEIPSNYSTGNCKFKLRMQCIATLAGSYANASISYIRIPRGSSTLSTLAEYSINCDISKTVEEATMFEVESSEIVVTPGDLLIVVINRTTNMTPVYNADLAIARINGILNVG